ncbi:SDR family oxidoreductase [Lutibaculum baratangense]|uniref:Oxidoreductase, short chain dehydrogenase/reductase family n=1 Tax=Lutibaculum baratangense AMV1 TaxID=631454 RepID=V4RJ93_9HYPH|nr:SDR family oxidoreductase [Lutibaculum baratangense]ESR23345.1 Oxidoreductase, short chain dehydrogenase/reductase family [Lutibaculum baratangense AMV1]
MSSPRVTLVTGAAQGIGAGIARQLVGDGWQVCLVDRAEEKLGRVEESFPAGTVAAMAADVSDPAQAARAVEEARSRFGRLDGLVSNAGIMVSAPVEQLSTSDWDRVLATNLSATFHLVRTAANHLREGGGSIVTIASTRAHMSEPDTEAYAASKGGLVALTHALAISLGPRIRVNCVSPGWIETEGYGELRPVDHAQHPAGRVGKVADVAQAVSFLLDGDRSGFVTGSEFVVDGGMTRKMIYAE